MVKEEEGILDYVSAGTDLIGTAAGKNYLSNFVGGNDMLTETSLNDAEFAAAKEAAASIIPNLRS